ncbi:hypothetical protein ET475_09665 [Microbacterium protaetiae]|uniref:Uncharacterized protein n=1 Tax=Microbacterium protaetiae TaxID=2509458 RepID=A0A4P6EGE1_9MICO|nr:hypothetical protein [Microbacterium protaetiae]QAY60229.1 hypothetical protein ET475_09665 [Microbacterium protaetiae]
MIGGRNGWIAWPVGILCLGVVGGLVWLAAPGVPGAVQFVSDMLRTGSAQAAGGSATPQPIESIGTAADDDCRSLYPDGLWAALTWQSRTVLNQSQKPPATSAEAVRDALAPEVLMTCAWRNDDGGTVTTTLSRVDAAAATIAGEAFSSSGFSCTALPGSVVRCTKTAGDTVEDDVVAGGMWLSTTAEAWHPDGYTDALVQRLWPR